MDGVEMETKKGKVNGGQGNGSLQEWKSVTCKKLFIFYKALFLSYY
jgi:hypothetical protein